MASRFPGFPPEAIRFLRALKKNNRREWFQPRKEQYETQVKAPMLELVAALNADLAKYAPEFITDPKKAVFRIYRDVRFSSDKRPYKTNIAASFHRRGVEGGGLYFSVSGDEVEVAAGIYHPSRETMLAVRQHLVENHTGLERLLADRKRKKLCGDLRGDELTRAPKGFDTCHPAIHLIKKTDWLLDVTLDASIATTPDIFNEVSARFRAMQPFVEFFNKPLMAARKPAIRPEDHW
jgi:uncharacterized protein (TIGR02453 family)